MIPIPLKFRGKKTLFLKPSHMPCQGTWRRPPPDMATLKTGGKPLLKMAWPHQEISSSTMKGPRSKSHFLSNFQKRTVVRCCDSKFRHKKRKKHLVKDFTSSHPACSSLPCSIPKIHLALPWHGRPPDLQPLFPQTRFSKRRFKLAP